MFLYYLTMFLCGATWLANGIHVFVYSAQKLSVPALLLSILMLLVGVTGMLFPVWLLFPPAT